MASGRVFDPLTLVRLAPVITTTASLWFAADQYMFLDTLLVPQHAAKAAEIIPSYFKTFFRRGIVAILTLYPLSIAAGVMNFYGHPSPASYGWYLAGTALATAHFAFVPAVAGPIMVLTGDDADGKVKGPEAHRQLRSWLNGHALRSVLVDLPSWLCFVVGTLKSLEPNQ